MSDYDMALLRIEHLEADTELIDGLRQALMEEQAANQALRAEIEGLRTRYNMLDMAYRMQLDEVKRLRNENPF